MRGKLLRTQSPCSWLFTSEAASVETCATLAAQLYTWQSCALVYGFSVQILNQKDVAVDNTACTLRLWCTWYNSNLVNVKTLLLECG